MEINFLLHNLLICGIEDSPSSIDKSTFMHVLKAKLTKTMFQSSLFLVLINFHAS